MERIGVATKKRNGWLILRFRNIAVPAVADCGRLDRSDSVAMEVTPVGDARSRSQPRWPCSTAQHHRFDVLAHGEHVGWTGDAFGPGEFGNVDEASFETGAFFDVGKRTVSHQLADLAYDVRASGTNFQMRAVDVFPWILLHLCICLIPRHI
jgi:hypothetical protein